METSFGSVENRVSLASGLHDIVIQDIHRSFRTLEHRVALLVAAARRLPCSGAVPVSVHRRRNRQSQRRYCRGRWRTCRLVLVRCSSWLLVRHAILLHALCILSRSPPPPPRCLCTDGLVRERQGCRLLERLTWRVSLFCGPLVAPLSRFPLHPVLLSFLHPSRLLGLARLFCPVCRPPGAVVRLGVRGCLTRLADARERRMRRRLLLDLLPSDRSVLPDDAGETAQHTC